MSAYSDEQKEYHRSRIQAILVLKPGASLREIKETLEKSQAPLELALVTIGKFRDKIIKERAHRNDRANKGTRISFIQDKIRKIDELLWQLVADKTTSDRAKTAALRTLAQNEMDLLKAEMDAGVYERTPERGILEVEFRRRAPLPAETIDVIAKAFEAWGINITDHVKQIGQPEPAAEPPRVAAGLPAPQETGKNA